jgi:hypothetical protein
MTAIEGTLNGFPFRARWPKKPLAQSGPEAERSCRYGRDPAAACNTIHLTI